MSHVVLSDPTSARGREERGRTERRGERKNRQRCAANGWHGRKRKRGDGDKKRTNGKDGARIKNTEKNTGMKGKMAKGEVRAKRREGYTVEDGLTKRRERSGR